MLKNSFENSDAKIFTPFWCKKQKEKKHCSRGPNSDGKELDNALFGI